MKMKMKLTHVIMTKPHEILQKILHLEEDFRVITKVSCLPKTPLRPIHFENTLLHDIINVRLIWRRSALSLWIESAISRIE
jgi:hypothetical protein